MNKITKKCLSGMILFVISLTLCLHAWAKGPIELSVATYREDGTYRKPFGRSIRITEQPMPFKIILKNISSSAAKLWKPSGTIYDNLVALEITDENNQTTTIYKKSKERTDYSRTYSLLGPGRTQEFQVIIDPDEWEGVPVLEEGKTKFFKIRAI